MKGNEIARQQGTRDGRIKWKSRSRGQQRSTYALNFGITRCTSNRAAVLLRVRTGYVL
jgi:hypothetical protein